MFRIKLSAVSRVWFGFLVVLLGGFVLWRLSFLSRMPRAVVHLSIDAEVSSPVAISRDGTTLVYAELHGDDTVLHLRRLEGAGVTRLSGTEGAAQPVFSPDRASIAFESSGALMTVTTGDGEPKRLAELPGLAGMYWKDEKTIVAGTARGLVAVDENGGLRALTHLQEGETAHRHPVVLPRGDWVLFDDTSRVEAVSLASGGRHVVVEDASLPRYSSTGHLLFVRDGALWAIRLEVESAAPVGAPVHVFDGIGSWYDLAENGTFGFSRPGRQGEPTIVSFIINWHEELERLTGLR